MTPDKEPTKWPLPIEQWEKGLKNHPDREETEKFVQQLKHGFRTTSNSEMETERNQMEYKNTLEDWRTIYTTIDKRLTQKCAWGPFPEDQIPPKYQQYHANPTFVKDEAKICVKTAKIIPKARTIIDCSNTENPGKAPNDFITEEEKTCQYPNIRDIVQLIVAANIIWMIAADAENAFNRVPIADAYIRHYAIRLAGTIIFWTALVFGGASSCKIYNTFAAFLRWLIIDEFPEVFIVTGIRVLINYLDDFFAGHPTLEGAWRQYNIIQYAFKKYGVPTQERKMNIPTQRLRYIGYIIDTKQQQIEIPEDKIIKLRLKIKEILSKHRKGHKITVHDISQLIGIVRYATNVQYYIIPNLRRLEGAVATKDPKQRIRLTQEMIMDIKMIQKAMQDPKRNRIKFKWLLYPKDKGDIVIETDASTGTGLGGIEMMDDGNYYGITYRNLPNWPKQNTPDIVFLELMAVFVMLAIQPQRYKKKAILLRVDNEAVCAILRKKSACLERKDLQQLVRLICEIAIKNEFYFWVKWIPTKQNVRADGLSRAEATALQTCDKKRMRSRNIDAMKHAATAIEAYKQARKNMHRHNMTSKRCQCENDLLCENQPLYPKWRHNLNYNKSQP